MNCCIRCFNDPEIKDIVKGCNSLGNCSFCDSKNVNICDITNTNLKENFERLLDVYCPVKDLDRKFPMDKADLLKNILCSQWNIFKLTPEKVYRFLTALLVDKYAEESRLFDEPVWVKVTSQEAYLSQYSILGLSQWSDFVDEIKTKNRFHTTTLNKEIFSKVLAVSCKEYDEGEKFYRARIWTDGHGFTLDKMGAPPALKASAGRANPEGISCLYLADAVKTTLHETRAGVYDCATVGEFILKKKICIVDLTSIDKISPFLMDDIDLLAANLEHLKKIGDEISRPLRRHDSSLDYLPTQYICDYIKSLGYHGIQYKSTMYSKGTNFAIFDESLLSCTSIINYEVRSLDYDHCE
ncbi:RES family NAD+ phosphorylase, partial [Dehalobacter restrictus]|uniref:RES family NAD+ phosphorylase n=1 Tax=Dehalobacter restrictus TaxID=55583 RepID=UPI003014ADB4